MAYKRQFSPSEVRCPVTGRWCALDRRALARLDDDPEALLAPLPPGCATAAAAAEAARAARNAEASRARLAAPHLLTRLRDGSCFPFGALTPRSLELSGPAIELFLGSVGRDFALRVRIDPSAAGAAGWHAEERDKKRAAREAARAARRAAARARLRDALRAELERGPGGPAAAAATAAAAMSNA